MRKLLCCSIVLVFFSAGCSFHKFNEKEYAFKGADQRLIYTVKANANDQLFRNKNNPNMIVCVEPSPDIAFAFSKALSAGLEASYSRGESSVNGRAYTNMSAVQSIAQLGERLATIQLIRDEMSDLCRAYANGSVSMTTYTIRLSRLDKKMVTLLMGELNAGAFGRNLAALSGSATASGGAAGSLDQINKATEDALSASKKVVEAEKALSDNKDDTKKQSLEDDLLQKKKDFADKITILTSLQVTNSLANTIGNAATNIGMIQNRPSSVSETLSGMHSSYLASDDINVLLDACISATDITIDPALVEKKQEEVKKEADKVKTGGKAKAVNSVLERLMMVPSTALSAVEREQLSKIDGASDLIKTTDDLKSMRDSLLSTFGQFCVGENGLPGIVKHIEQANAEKIRAAEASSENQLLLECLPYVKTKSNQEEQKKYSAQFKQYCDALMAKTLGPDALASEPTKTGETPAATRKTPAASGKTPAAPGKKSTAPKTAK